MPEPSTPPDRAELIRIMADAWIAARNPAVVLDDALRATAMYARHVAVCETQLRAIEAAGFVVVPREREMSESTSEPMTASQWRKRQEPTGAATPLCPGCKQHLGILPGLWRDSGGDTWLCDACGQWERA